MKGHAALGVLAMGLALVGTGWAREKKEREPAKHAAGTIVSAAVEGMAVRWKFAVDMEGEKTYEMPVQVAIVYHEKDGQRLARLLQTPGKRALEAKGNMLVAQGTLVKAEVEGNKVVVTLKTGEGEDAAQQDFTMTRRLSIAYTEGPPLAATAISSEGRARRQDGVKPDKPRAPKPGKDAAVKPPENL